MATTGRPVPPQLTPWTPGQVHAKRPTETRDLRIPAHYKAKTFEVILELYDIAMDRSLSAAQRYPYIKEYLDRSLGKSTVEIRATLEDKRPIVIDATLSDIVQSFPQDTLEIVETVETVDTVDI